MNSLKWLKGLKNLRIGGVAGSGTTGPSPTALNGSEAESLNLLILSRQASTSTSAVKKPPKRPLSPYLRFAMAERENLAKANPKLKAAQLMSLLGNKWTNLADTEKQPYVKQFQEDLPKYSQILAEYKDSLTEADIDALKKDKLDKELRKEKREKRERVKELGKPKKPPTPFLMFIMDRAQKGIDPKAYSEKCKEFAKEWKAMVEEDKKRYLDKYETLRQKFDRDLDKWEQRMLKLGNTDVVRLNTLRSVNAEKSD